MWIIRAALDDEEALLARRNVGFEEEAGVGIGAFASVRIEAK